MLSTVLVVDDDPIHRSLLERIVTRLGYGVQTAQSGADALRLLDSPAGQAIDILLLDLVMPDLDGMGVLNRLASIGSLNTGRPCKWRPGICTNCRACHQGDKK